MFERGDLLRAPVLENLEVGAREIGDGAPLPIDHANVERDERDAALEGAGHPSLLS